MRHKRKQADPDVAAVLLSGLTGIHPRNINGYAVFTFNDECGIHVTTNACCAHHAVELVMAECRSELPALVPCSDGSG